MTKKTFAVLLSLCMALSLLSSTALATSMPLEQVNLSGGTTLTTNQDHHSYTNFDPATPSTRKWAENVRSNMTELDDDTLMLTRQHTNGVVVQYFDKSGEFLSEKTIPLELERYGGFYANKDNYFLFFAQSNKSQDDALETFRLVKYSKDWERLGQASVSDTRTTVPFRSGSTRMAEINGKLYIHTNHEMYASDKDGFNHQANITFIVDIAKMIVTDKCSLRETHHLGGYVSHSFNQYISVGADGTVFTADHGDAYPRSMIVVKRDLTYLFMGDGRSLFLPFEGEIGDVFTGAQLGGLAVTPTSVLTVGTIINQDRSDVGLHNVYISVTNKNDVDTPAAVTMLTAYESKVTAAGNPHLLALGDDLYIILWNEKSAGNTSSSYLINKNNPVLCYAIVNGSGKQIGEIERTNAMLSDCPPILTAEGKVMWYASNGRETTLYALDTSDISTPKPAIPFGSTATATPSNTKLTVNGEPVGVDAYQIDGNNFIKLRDLAYIVNGTAKNFNVLWDEGKSAINLVSEATYDVIDTDMKKGDGKIKTATASTSKIYVNGAKKALSAYNIGGSNYFKLRDIMKVFDIYVGYDDATATASLDTSKSY